MIAASVKELGDLHIEKHPSLICDGVFLLKRVSGEAKWVILCGMEHTYIIMLAADSLAKDYLSETSFTMVMGFILLGLIMVAALIGAIYSMKSNERIKFEQERTKQKTIEAVSEGKLSIDDAEKLLKREKKAWWEKLF